MRNRIPINDALVDEDTLTRRSVLTWLARIAKACGAIAVFGLTSELAYASGNLGVRDKIPQTPKESPLLNQLKDAARKGKVGD